MSAGVSRSEIIPSITALLTKPTTGETLYLYLTANQQTVSSVLIKEEEGFQKPIYYVSKVLHGVEQRYPEVEKSAIKAQALAELVNEATFTEGDEGNWLLNVDGSSTLAGSGAGVVLTSSEWDELEYALRFDFKASNNETEYEAPIAGIRMALDAGARNLIAYSDSQLVTKQVEGEYEVKEERMKEYLQEIR
ncbi:UNVERIFIED_CONTAM: hypothetical protein Slati_1935800 [Sesamum latifolium]|uniref:RNase H type-1 domain-containing protein n=1 Tax=Sesamum latifolium TaxID=2727402 RepID=A0AAW2X485_9LAMI